MFKVSYEGNFYFEILGFVRVGGLFIFSFISMDNFLYLGSLLF